MCYEVMHINGAEQISSARRPRVTGKRGNKKKKKTLFADGECDGLQTWLTDDGAFLPDVLARRFPFGRTGHSDVWFLWVELRGASTGRRFESS